MSKFQNIVWLVLVALLTAPVDAQLTIELPSGYPDARTLTVQRKVEDLFQRGEFDRAYFIYRNELAPTGDKYAQYMVGYMQLTGMGTNEDPVAAYAWYRLAAERGTPEFMAVRDQLMHDLQAEDRRRADDYYRQLRREYDDLVILLASIKRDLRELGSATGSHLMTDSTPVSVVYTRTRRQGRSSADYYGGVRRQLEESLKTFAKLGDFPDLDTNPDRVDVDELERLVNERLESNQE